MELDGIAIGITIRGIDGKPIEFKLGCVIDETRTFNLKPTFVFIEAGNIPNEERRMATSIYSGGTTGCGISNYEVNRLRKAGEVQILTTDPEAAINLMAFEEKKENDAEDLERQRKQRVVEKLNQLPESFKTGFKNKEGYEFVVIRSKASFNPSFSRHVDCRASVYKNYKTAGGTYVSLDSYKTKDGKVKRKQIAMDLNYLMASSVEEAIGNIEKMRAVLADVRKQIQDIVNNTK